MISTRPIFIISLNLYHRLNLQTHFTFNFKPRLFYNVILIWYWCLIAESTIPGHWIDYRLVAGRYYYWNKGLLLCWFKTRFIVGIQGMREMAKKDPWKSFFSPAFFVAVLIFLLNKKKQLFLFATNQWVRCWLIQKHGMLKSKMPAPVPQLLISTQLLTDSRGDTACCCFKQ